VRDHRGGPAATGQLRSGAALPLALVGVLLSACGGGAPGTSIAPSGHAATAAPPATTVPSLAPTATPIPDPLSLPLREAPTGYRRGATVPFTFNLMVDGVMVDSSIDRTDIRRWDASTHEPLETIRIGTPGVFPPDLQSAWRGADGVWVTLASEHAVALLDIATGEELRRITVGAYPLEGWPYDIVEVGTELWIADFERSQVTRYDLEADAAVATIGVSSPTDVLFGEGALWVPVHIGRSTEQEPIDAPGGQLARIDPATNEIVERIWVGHRPYYLAIGFGAVWTGNATSATVSRVDAATNLATAIPVGEDGAFDIEVIGDSVWTVVGPQWPPSRRCDPTTSFFVRIDPTTGAVSERIGFPCAVSITPDGEGFWVSGDAPDGPLSVQYVPDR
jgi:hypothetical protein